ncbi:MAG TPA: hypothetical protein VF613_01820 [Longimicrobium sp.]|jgi:antitoxin ParD1/3/4
MNRSTSEAAHAELQRLEEKAEYAARLKALREDIQIGLDEAERGELVDGEEVFRRAFERIAQLEGGGAT